MLLVHAKINVNKVFFFFFTFYCRMLNFKQKDLVRKEICDSSVVEKMRERVLAYREICLSLPQNNIRVTNAWKLHLHLANFPPFPLIFSAWPFSTVFTKYPRAPHTPPHTPIAPRLRILRLTSSPHAAVHGSRNSRPLETSFCHAEEDVQGFQVQTYI